MKALESTPAHWFKCIYREFRRFSVCNKKFLDVLKLVKCNIYFEYKIDFPFHIFKSMASANLKQHLLLDGDSETATWIKTEESPQYKFYYDTGDLSIRSCWHHSSDTNRNPWVMLCSHCPTPFTLQLCYKTLGILQKVTKTQKVHISSHDGLQKLYNINLVWHK